MWVLCVWNRGGDACVCVWVQFKHIVDLWNFHFAYKTSNSAELKERERESQKQKVRHYYVLRSMYRRSFGHECGSFLKPFTAITWHLCCVYANKHSTYRLTLNKAHTLAQLLAVNNRHSPFHPMSKCTLPLEKLFYTLLHNFRPGHTISFIYLFFSVCLYLSLFLSWCVHPHSFGIVRVWSVFDPT